MSHQVYEVHTWNCSIPDCKEILTGYGDGYAEDQGWDQVTIFGEDFDLCPSCVKEVRKFFFND